MTTVFKVEGKTIRPGKGWVDQYSVTHPANWMTYSSEKKKELGITEIVQETPPDSRLYIWSYNDDGTINSTAKSLEDINQVDENGDPVLDEKGNQAVSRGVKYNLKQEVKSQQGSLLSQTDWCIIRKADKGIVIPDNIQTWRDAIRTKATEMETAIDNAADTDAVAALFLTYTINEDGSQTKSGILYDWPELD